MKKYDEMMNKNLNDRYQIDFPTKRDKVCFYALKHSSKPNDMLSHVAAPALFSLGVHAATKRKYNDDNTARNAASAAGIISFATQLRLLKNCIDKKTAVENFETAESMMRTLRGCLYSSLNNISNSKCIDTYQTFVDKFKENPKNFSDPILDMLSSAASS